MFIVNDNKYILIALLGLYTFRIKIFLRINNAIKINYMFFIAKNQVIFIELPFSKIYRSF